uniref:Uncharacterized protein n=1 Tax=Peronospora matthiolae TaxID=2874970 RepID=A0AAV1V9X9_9STRA
MRAYFSDPDDIPTSGQQSAGLKELLRQRVVTIPHSITTMKEHRALGADPTSESTGHSVEPPPPLFGRAFLGCITPKRFVQESVDAKPPSNQHGCFLQNLARFE